jgi:hypothetical protein
MGLLRWGEAFSKGLMEDADIAGIVVRMADVALEVRDKSTMRAAVITAVPIIAAGDVERLKRI